MILYIKADATHTIGDIYQLEQHAEGNPRRMAVISTRDAFSESDRHKPQVSFALHNIPGFKDAWHLDLELNEDLLDPSFETHNPGSTDHTVENCYYHGRIREHADSMVALSTCNSHLNGLIEVSGRSYEIGPQTNDDGQILVKRNGSILHQLKLSGDRTEHGVHCEQNEAPLMLGSDPNGITPATNRTLVHLFRRDNNRKYIELLLVNDWSRVQALGKNLESHTLKIANAMSAKMKRISGGLGREVIITLLGIWNAPRPLWVTNDAKRAPAGGLLKEFSDWRRDQINDGANRNSALGRNDVAQLLTTRDIYLGGNSQVNGYSNMGAMCSVERSTGVVEAMADYPLAAQVNLNLHELGHNLNMQHDGSNGCSQGDDLMAPSICRNCRGIENTQFSSCSYREGRQFLSSGAQCLNNSPVQARNCGNGVVDTNEGEECDDGNRTDGCCDMRTCRFKRDGSGCKANKKGGSCDRGKCIGTCGNGVLDPNEECDPKISSSGCCDADTCKFKNMGAKCSKGVCDGGDQCRPANLLTLTAPVISITEKQYFSSYEITIEAPNATQVRDIEIFYTIDGTTPTTNKSISKRYSSKFEMRLVDILAEQQRITDANARLNNGSIHIPNPFLPDEVSGLIQLNVTAKLYHPSYLASPLTWKQIEFNPNAVDLHLTELGESQMAGIASGAVFGVIGAFMLAGLGVYKTRDPVTRKQWRAKALIWYANVTRSKGTSNDQVEGFDEEPKLITSSRDSIVSISTHDGEDVQEIRKSMQSCAMTTIELDSPTDPLVSADVTTFSASFDNQQVSVSVDSVVPLQIIDCSSPLVGSLDITTESATATSLVVSSPRYIMSPNSSKLIHRLVPSPLPKT